MKPDCFLSSLRRLRALGACALLFLCRPALVNAAVYVHKSPLTFAWTAATGSVDHYHVYVSLDGGVFNLHTQVSSTTCTMVVADGRRYRIQVDAEDPQGNLGPMSDPSEEVVVFLNGSSEDTDGDRMPDVWEVAQGFNPYNPSDGTQDRDSDGLSNREEFLSGTSPSVSDTDHDGALDGAEVRNGQDPLSAVDNMPTARSGQDQEVDPTVVTLDGSGSSDPNGDPLRYAWAQTAGTSVKLSDATVSKPTFVGKKKGDYRFRLVVNDGKVDSLPDDVAVRVRNVKPAASAGGNHVVDAGTRVVLDGSGSRDPNEDPLRFSWVQTDGLPVALQNANTQSASFVPSTSGVYRFELSVCDDELCGDPDDVQVIVNAENHVPSANAGQDQTVRVQDTVTLDGSGSTDADGNPLLYSWSQTEGPQQVVLQGATTVRARFSPTRAGVYRFELVVNDGTDSSPADSVTVTVEGLNHRPVAVVDAVVEAEVGDWIALDGSESFDPDGDVLSYVWSQKAGAQVTLNSEDSAVAGFYAVTEGVLAFELVVHDGELSSEPARVEAVVAGANRAPVADAGESLVGPAGEEICLDGSGSHDPDPQDVLTYTWSQTEGPAVTLNGSRTATPCFTASNLGEYVFRLTVSDGRLQSAQDTVTVSIREPSGETPGDPPSQARMHSSSSGGGCSLAKSDVGARDFGLEEFFYLAILFVPAFLWTSCQRRKACRKAD